MSIRTKQRADVYPRFPGFIPRVARGKRSRRHSRAFAALLGVACLCILAGVSGCNQYNPYLGATPTVSSSITSITPSAATVSLVTQDVLLTVNGAGFVAGSNVTWNSSGSASTYLVSNFISANEMQADIPMSLLATPGTFFVGVIAPGPSEGNNAGNNISNFMPFTVCSSSCPAVVTGAGADNAAMASAKLTRLSALIQAGARYQSVVADSADGSLVPEGGIAKIFLRDTCLDAASCAPQIFPVSVGWNGADPNGPSSTPSVTADGRFVVFASEADNLVKGDTNGWSDIFLRDTCIGSASTCVPATFRLSLGPGGDEANGPSSSPTISPDGRFVAFHSSATNLAPQLAGSIPAGVAPPLFLRDTCFGVTAPCVPNTSLVISAPSAPQK